MNDDELYGADELDDHLDNAPPRCSSCRKTLPVEKKTVLFEQCVLFESVHISYVRLEYDGEIVEVDDHEGDYCKECWEKIQTFIKTLVK